ncbi:hypothetical protein QAD02_023445 [Eretmocerus hayati]|uniref:Uncharacterized protein n=1 Tax=Eretmocerus hayati TaxID=131215 RepID=A0ACC2PVU3_9HYME|nr:hypothetical protein QAD02_023445 [Eretmocerus hayati]
MAYSNFSLLFTLALTLIFVNGQQQQDKPELETKFGRIRGLWLKTTRGAKIAGFRGLPYAEPPLGELRFENPRPWREKWNGTRDSSTDGDMCLQRDYTTGAVVGDEDCLYLNVFAPASIIKNGNESKAKNFSVLVFIHGGAFNTGSSNSSLLAPTYLLDHNIVVVTMNYRLNILGFFSTGNDITPGNYGLKDIAMALAWVHDNIADFGGDPNSVTLSGQSSGAAAAQLLSSSKATEGYFQKLITMSGSATAFWSIHTRENIRNSSMYVARLLGCQGIHVNDTNMGSINGSDIEKTTRLARDPKQIDKMMKKCMKNLDAREIIHKGVDALSVWRRNPSAIFGPTLEADIEGAILTVHPTYTLEKGLFRDIPWIVGLVEDEGLLKTTDLILNSQLQEELVQNYKNLLVPYVLEMENHIDEDNVTAVTQAIENFYFNGSFKENINSNITELVGDALITYSSYDNLEKQIVKKNSSTYFYVFAYEGTFSASFRRNTPFHFGVAHGDDLNYLFPYLNARYADLQLYNTMSDITMLNIMCEMWTNFAKTGVPSARLVSSWEPYGTKNRRFMKFGNGKFTDSTMKSNFLPERMNFWSDLVANYSIPVMEFTVKIGEDSEKVRPSEENKKTESGSSRNRVTCGLMTLSLAMTLITWTSDAVFLRR